MLNHTETGDEKGNRGVDGCKAIAPMTTRDLPPSRLPACLNADLCHPLPTRDCFLTKQHKQERVHADTDDTRRNTHTRHNMHKEREGNKGQALPPSVFIKDKSDQDQLPITPCKAINIFRRGAKENGGH